MRQNYPTRKIEDICEEIYDGPHATPEKIDQGPVFLGVSNLDNGRLDLSDTDHVSPEDFREWTRRVTPGENDLVFSYETRLGEAALIPEGLECCLGRRMGLIRPERNVMHPRYLLYAWLSPEFQRTIQANASQGSTVNRILLTDLGGYQIRVPPLPTQRRIAEILGALDDKIELNRQMNETLETIAQTLYRHWFVDFGPFQDQPLVDSELGPIPEGWEVKPLDEIASFLNGTAWGRYKPDDDDEPTTRVIKIRELRGGFDEKSDLVGKNKLPKKYFIRDGDVIFSWSGSLVLKIWTHGLGALNQHLFKVSSDQYPKWFFYYALQRYVEYFRRIAESKATTMGHIKRSHLSEALVAVPPLSVLSRAESLISPLFERRLANFMESRLLSETRDYLLPKLISGEIEVEVAEQHLEAIA